MTRPWIRRMPDAELVRRIEWQEGEVGEIDVVYAMGECHVGDPYELPDYHAEMLSEAQSRGLLPTPTGQASEPEGESK